MAYAMPPQLPRGSCALAGGIATRTEGNCPFSAIGCNSSFCCAREVDTLHRHLSLILEAVLDLRRRCGSSPETCKAARTEQPCQDAACLQPNPGSTANFQVTAGDPADATDTCPAVLQAPRETAAKGQASPKSRREWSPFGSPRSGSPDPADLIRVPRSPEPVPLYGRHSEAMPAPRSPEPVPALRSAYGCHSAAPPPPFPEPLPAPRSPAQIPCSPGARSREVPKATSPDRSADHHEQAEFRPHSAPVLVSSSSNCGVTETGQRDLLRLLQGSQVPDDQFERRPAALSSFPPSSPSPPSPRKKQLDPQTDPSRVQDGPFEGFSRTCGGDRPPVDDVETKINDIQPSGAPQAGNGAPESEAHNILNSVTAELQAGRIPHAEAVTTFTTLIEALPAGRLRCSALLNRAHCYVGLCHFEAALADIEKIVSDQSPDVCAEKWHKVWMSRGGIHRKLAQVAALEDEDPLRVRASALYAKSRGDYKHVLAIDPRHNGYCDKAQRCLNQLDNIERKRPQPQLNPNDCSSPSASSGFPLVFPASPRPEAASAASGSCSPPALSSSSSTGQASSPFPTSGQASSISASGLSSPVKRRRLGAPSEERHAGVDFRALKSACTPAVSSTAAPAVGNHEAPRRAARSLIDALGMDCSTSGLELYREGAVQERGGEMSDKRTFEVRSHFGVQPETVVINRTGGTADNGIGINGSGATLECSCWLREHCKHVAAALWVLAKEEENLNFPGGSGSPTAPQVWTPSMYRRREVVERKLEKRTIEELKKYLKLNNQLLAGTKPEIIRRVADGVVFGAVSQCPKCSGHLHPDPLPNHLANNAQPAYRCRKINRDREACGFEVAGELMERRFFMGAEQLG